MASRLRTALAVIGLLGVLGAASASPAAAYVVFRCDLPASAPDLYCSQQMSLQSLSTPGSYLRRVGDQAIVGPASGEDSGGTLMAASQSLPSVSGSYVRLPSGSVLLSQGDGYLASVAGWVGFVPAAVAEQRLDWVSWAPEYPAGQTASADPLAKPPVTLRLQSTGQYLMIGDGDLQLAPAGASPEPGAGFQVSMPLTSPDASLLLIR
jgi:hypothetical protein